MPCPSPSETVRPAVPLPGYPRAAPAEPLPKAIEEEVDDRGRVQREDLADDQSADDGDAERAASSEPVPVPKASGKAPSRAAMVVIRMGRKRSRQA